MWATQLAGSLTFSQISLPCPCLFPQHQKSLEAALKTLLTNISQAEDTQRDPKFLEVAPPPASLPTSPPATSPTAATAALAGTTAEDTSADEPLIPLGEPQLFDLTPDEWALEYRRRVAAARADATERQRRDGRDSGGAAGLLIALETPSEAAAEASARRPRRRSLAKDEAAGTPMPLTPLTPLSGGVVTADEPATPAVLPRLVGNNRERNHVRRMQRALVIELHRLCALARDLETVSAQCRAMDYPEPTSCATTLAAIGREAALKQRLWRALDMWDSDVPAWVESWTVGDLRSGNGTLVAELRRRLAAYESLLGEATAAQWARKPVVTKLQQHLLKVWNRYVGRERERGTSSLLVAIVRVVPCLPTAQF